MDAHSLRVLEYEKVLAIIAKLAHWEPGARIIMDLLPAADLEEVLSRQEQVKEASRLYDQATGIGAGGLVDCMEAIRGAQRGRVVSGKDLLSVMELARASRKTGTYLRSHSETFPQLADRALGMGTFVSLEEAIGHAISPEGRVSDNASDRLRELRSSLCILQGRIKEHLNGVLRNTAYSRMLQESIVTVRSERYVIPIKAEYRGHFPGLIIDQSASGATLFMEPWSVVELGNRVRAAVLEEQKEVEAVLAKLSGLVGLQGASLERSFEELAWFDAMYCLAAYLRRVTGILPEIVPEGALRLFEARHPLLVERLGKGVVPTTLDFQAEAETQVRTLVVTGPNTGGKTVTLKTTGLLLLMSLAGIPIPAKAGTVVPFQDELWADIGDEQSISQNLSTFSAHMTQILRIIPKAGPRTFILIDELGAGTDPSEGSALGMALLEYFHSCGARTIVTTHLAELKVYASKTPGVSNAAVEFNSETLAPTFAVTMGIPGRSNALRIAYRLGLPGAIERRAREYLGHNHVEVEGLLNDLEQERDLASRLKEHLHNEQAKAQELREGYEDRLERIEEERREILEQAQSQAQGFVDEARQKLHGLLRGARENLASLDRVRRQSLKDCQKAAQELADTLLKSDDLEIFAELSPVASELLAQALQEACLRKYPNYQGERSLSNGAGSQASSSSSMGLSSLLLETVPDSRPLVTLDSLDAANSLKEKPGPVKLGTHYKGQAGQAKPEQEVEEDYLPMTSETPTGSQTPVDSFDQCARQTSRRVEAELEELVGQAEALLPKRAVSAKATAKPEKPDLELKVGATVYVHRYGQEGTVLSISGSVAEVKIGVIRIKVALKELEVIKTVHKSSVVLPPSKAAVVSTRVDLIGLTVDEALHKLDYSLDEAFMGHVQHLDIIHGKGTGALRKAVVEYVSHHPMVVQHRYGEVYEGGVGVTVVTLK